MRGVVILSIFDWWYHSHGHSDMQLARTFSRRMPVLFVNSIGMRLPRRSTATAPMRRIARKLGSTARLLKFVDPALNIAVLTPVALPIYSGIWGTLNTASVEWQIRFFLKKLDISNPIVIVTVPTYAPVGFNLRREALFYNRSDLHSEFAGVDQGMVRKCEELLFLGADAILFANEQLFRSEKDKIARRAVLIGHGVDADLFTPAGSIAPELSDLPRPRVGFFGELRDRAVDFNLIASVARLCPSIQFVLGGTQLDNLSQLRELPNIRILPSCPHHQMPARWRALDAAILPYKRTAWQEASEPIKLNEILAMGLNAIGTPLPALTRHPGSVEVAEGAESFAAAIRKVVALSGLNDLATREARRAAVSLTSWESIVDRIDQLSRSCATAPLN
jgi:glycosyltransferase involved in cell wall biosynthesis